MSQQTVTARNKKQGVFIYDLVDCRTSLVQKDELSKWIGHGQRYLTLEGRPFLNISELRPNITLTLHASDSLLGGSKRKPTFNVEVVSLDNIPSLSDFDSLSLSLKKAASQDNPIEKRKGFGTNLKNDAKKAQTFKQIDLGHLPVIHSAEDHQEQSGSGDDAGDDELDDARDDDLDDAVDDDFDDNFDSKELEADIAVKSFRETLHQELWRPGLAKDLQESHLAILQEMKQELELKNDQYELLIAICVQLPKHRLQQFNAESQSRSTSLMSETSKNDGSKQILKKFSTFLKTLNIKETFYVTVALSPTKISQRLSLTSEQQEFVFLLQSATNSIFIDFMNEVIEQVGESKDLENFKAQMQLTLNKASAKDKHNLLEKWSNPQKNGLFWRALSTNDMFQLATLINKKSDPCCLDTKEHLLKNCETHQIESLLKLMDSDQLQTLELTWLDMLYVPQDETEKELEAQSCSEVIVKKSKPKSIARIERPGAGGNEVIDLIQLGDEPKLTYSLKQGLIVELRFQLLFYKKAQKERKYLLQQVIDIKPDCELVSLKSASLRCDKTKGMKKPRVQYFFGGYGEAVFFFTRDSLSQRNYSLNIVTISKNGAAQVEVSDISHDSDLYHTLNETYYFNNQSQKPQSIWPTLIKDHQSGIRIIVFKLENSIAFYDVEASKEIVQVDGASMFFCQSKPEQDLGIGCCFFEEFGILINFEKARQSDNRQYFDSSKADYKWKPSIAFKIKQFLSSGCYKTRTWQKADKQGFTLKGSSGEWTICSASLVLGGRIKVEKHAFDKSTTNSFEAFVASFLAPDQPVPDPQNLTGFFTPNSQICGSTKSFWPVSEQKFVVDQPLVFRHDRAFPHCFSANNLHLADQEGASDQIYQLDFVSSGRIFAFGPMWSNNKKLPALGILSISLNERQNEQASMITLRQRQSMRKGAIHNKKRWHIDEEDQNELSYEAFSGFKEITEFPNASFFFEEGTNRFVFLYWKQKIILVTCKDKPEVLFENKEYLKLGKVDPLRYVEQSEASMSWWRTKGYFYYVVRDINARLEHIYLLHQENGKMTSSRVFTVERSTIQALKMQGSEYLLILDTDMNFIRAKRSGIFKFKLVSTQSLKLIERLKEAITKLRQCQRVELSDRVLLAGDYVFSLESGKRFKLSHEEHTVASFDDIILRDNGNELFLRSGPGSRRLVIGSALFQNAILSTHQVSKDLLLFRWANKKRSKEFWTLMSTRGKLQEVSHNLNRILHSQNRWSAVHSLTMWDGRCRIVLEQVTHALEEQCYALVLTLSLDGDLAAFKRVRVPGRSIQPDNGCVELDRSLTSSSEESIMSEGLIENKNETSQQLLAASNSGVKNAKRRASVNLQAQQKRQIMDNCLDQSRNSAFQRKGTTTSIGALQVKLMKSVDQTVPQYATRRVMLSSLGQLLVLSIKTEKNDFVSAPQLIRQEDLDDQLSCPDMPDQLIFEYGDSTGFVFAGEFICWVVDKDDQPKLKVFDICGGGISEALLQPFIDKEKSEIITVDACSPFVLMRIGGPSSVDRKSFKQLANHVQVSIGLRYLIFDLNGNVPSIVNELDSNANNELANPQNFVETGFKIYLITEKEKRRCIEASDFGNLVFEYEEGAIRGIYRQFAKIDFLEYRSLKTAAQMHRKPKDFAIQTLWASFGNETILTYLKDDVIVLKALENWLSRRDFKPTMLQNGETQCNSDLSKLNFMMIKKSFFEKKNTWLETTSLLSRKLDCMGTRDTLLRMGALCPEFSVCRFLSDQESFRKIIDNISPKAIESLETCFLTTPTTRQFLLLQWPSQLSILTYMSHSSAPSIEAISKEIKKAHLELRGVCRNYVKTVQRPVTIRILNMEWFYRDEKNFISLSSMLQDLPNSFYSSQFIICILDRFWSMTQRQIIIWQFLPYVAYIGTNIFYMHDTLMMRLNEDGKTVERPYEEWLPNKILGVVVLIFWVFNIYNELKQARGVINASNRNCCDYFKSVWNLLDIAGFSLTLIITVHTLQEFTWLSMSDLRTLAAIASCFIFIKMFDWLRLFEKTAFYQQLVMELLYEIRHFGILILLSILMFGLPLMMLNLNRQDDNQLIRNTYDWWLWDGIVTEGFSALGFSYNSNQPGDQEGLIGVFFFFSIFFTKTTMVSMLINVMSDIYSYVVENKEVNSTRTKLTFLFEQAGVLPFKKREEEECRNMFMIILKPSDTLGYDDDNWSGQINEIARINQNQTDLLGKKLFKRTDALQKTLNDYTKKDSNQDRHLKSLVQVEIKSVRKDVALLKDSVKRDITEVKDMLQDFISSQLQQQQQQTTIAPSVESNL